MPNTVMLTAPADFSMTILGGRPAAMELTDAGMAKLAAAGWSQLQPSYCDLKFLDANTLVIEPLGPAFGLRYRES